MDDIDKLDAALDRLEAERERRVAERIEAGEIVSVPLFVVAGSEAAARAQVEGAKADKLAELRAAGETREVVFDVTIIVTGVVKFGEATETKLWKPAPFLPTRVSTEADASVDLPEAIPEEPPPPVIETYITVQTRKCYDDDDPGEIAEGWFSVDGRTVTVTAANGKYVGSRVMLKGEDAHVVAKRLLRENPGGREL